MITKPHSERVFFSFFLHIITKMISGEIITGVKGIITAGGKIKTAVIIS
jgi:hypothetical protein